MSELALLIMVLSLVMISFVHVLVQRTSKMLILSLLANISAVVSIYLLGLPFLAMFAFLIFVAYWAGGSVLLFKLRDMPTAIRGAPKGNLVMGALLLIITISIGGYIVSLMQGQELALLIDRSPIAFDLSSDAFLMFSLGTIFIALFLIMTMSFVHRLIKEENHECD